MLLVDTYLDRSPLSGIGVFARTPIPRGTRIWQPQAEVDLRFAPEAWEAWLAPLSPAVREDMRRLSYKEAGHLVLCLDNARYMNHGGAGSNVANAPHEDFMYARVDIPAGAELLCDYREYSDADDCHLQVLGLASAQLGAAPTAD